MFLGVNRIFAAVLISATALTSATASAETIFGALAKAYQYNSTLNSARAGVRVTDENVPIAKSGQRPVIAGSGSINYSSSNGASSSRLTTGSFGVQIQQNLFDGFQTKNNVRAAQSQVRASNESLRNQEQNTLFDAASAYMDVIRDRQIAVLTERNLQFLTEQSRAARSRFEVGEGTRTDVSQADASRATAVAQVAAAKAQAQSSAATYRRVIGDDPGNLKGAAPLSKLLPNSLAAGIALGEAQHPAILATQQLVDAAAYSVKSAEGQLLPQLSASAGVSSSYRNSLPGVGGGPIERHDQFRQHRRNPDVPIYQGGRTSAQVRQSKESLGQARIEVDVSRDQVRNCDGRRLDAIHSRARKPVGEPRGRFRRTAGAQRRQRRAQCRPAHHARRAERPGRRDHRADQPRQCRARCRRGELCHPLGRRPAVGGNTWTTGRDLQA